MNVFKTNTRTLKRLLYLFKPYIQKVIMIIVCIILSSGMSMLLPLISKQIMDNGLLKGDFRLVARFTAAALALVILDQSNL